MHEKKLFYWIFVALLLFLHPLVQGMRCNVWYPSVRLHKHSDRRECKNVLYENLSMKSIAINLPWLIYLSVPWNITVTEKILCGWVEEEVKWWITDSLKASTYDKGFFGISVLTVRSFRHRSRLKLSNRLILFS